MLKKIKSKLPPKRYFGLLAFFIFLFLRGFSGESVFDLSQPEILIINQRRSYYHDPNIGRLMENKAGVIADKFARNFFQGLDINYYFFSNHPRERAGVTEVSKFHWFLLLPFLAGIYDLMTRRKKFIFVYFFSVLIFVSLFSGIDRYWYLIFPFFIFVIAVGLIKLFSIFNNAKR